MLGNPRGKTPMRETVRTLIKEDEVCVHMCVCVCLFVCVCVCVWYMLGNPLWKIHVCIPTFTRTHTKFIHTYRYFYTWGVRVEYTGRVPWRSRVLFWKFL